MNFVINHAPWCRIDRSTCWPAVQHATTELRTPLTIKYKINMDDLCGTYLSYIFMWAGTALINPINFLLFWTRTPQCQSLSQPGGCNALNTTAYSYYHATVGIKHSVNISSMYRLICIGCKMDIVLSISSTWDIKAFNESIVPRSCPPHIQALSCQFCYNCSFLI